MKIFFGKSQNGPAGRKKDTNVKHKSFEELVPLALPLLNKHIRLVHAGIVDHCVDSLIPDLQQQQQQRKKKERKEGMDRSNNNFKIII